MARVAVLGDHQYRPCACGWSDCSSPGKHPLQQLAPHGLLNATDNAAIITGWWEEFPQANVGIRTGAESGLVVVDLDGKQGIDAFEEYVDGRILPMTPVATTGRGQHYYFKCPADSEVKNRTKIAGRPIDIRAANGYVVAPPSTHITGIRYQWLKSPHDVAIAQGLAGCLN